MNAKQGIGLGNSAFKSMLIGILLFAGVAASVTADPAPSVNTPIASVLKPDGGLDLPKGFSGALDLKGYQMVTGPNGEPRFVSAAAPGPIPPSTPGPESDPSDVYWDDQFGYAGVIGFVYTAAVDSSGHFYVGGHFIAVENVLAASVAKWDGTSWSSLGSGTSGPVRALAASGNSIYAGGDFTDAGGVNANHIAKWDGTSWSSLGIGTDGSVLALAVSGNDLYAGGDFANAGGANANYIAKWDGTSWSSLGIGTDGSVRALAASGSGVYAGGVFTSAGGAGAYRVAKWNGSSWSALGSGMDDCVNALAANGDDVYAGGVFTTAGGANANYIAKWNGSTWSALGSGMDGTVGALAVCGDDLYVGGQFTTAGGVSANCMAKWDGSSWSTLGGGTNGIVRALAANGDDLYAGGVFTTAGGGNANSIAKWNGSSWSAVGNGMVGSTGRVYGGVSALAARGDDVYAGGWFTAAGEVSANYIANWDGASWSTLDGGVNGYVLAVAASGSNLYAAGGFTAAGEVSANSIASWSGSSWSALGGGMNGGVYALAVRGDDLCAGGWFTTAGGVSANSIAKWDGFSWSALGSGMDDSVSALAASGNNLYAGGGFTTAGGVSANYVAKWDGSSWSALGSGMNVGVAAIAVSGDDLYAGGRFTTAGGVSANYVAKWDGSSWSALGSGMDNYVYALAASGSNLYAGGEFEKADGTSARHVAKWDGSSWSALGSGIDGEFPYPHAYALAAIRNSLFVGGQFAVAGNKVSGYFAVWQPRVNTSSKALPAAPGAMTIGDDIYGFYKPALMTGAGTTVSYAGGVPVSVTLDRAPEICVGGERVNGAFTVLPAGIGFGGDGAVLRVEFSEDDVTSYPGHSYVDFRAVQLIYPADYPATKEAAAITMLSNDIPVPIRIENGRQIYAITLPVMEIGGAYGAVPHDCVTSAANLSLTKVSLPDMAKQGQAILYRLTVTNTETGSGPGSTAYNVIVTDELPSLVQFTSATASQGSASFAGGVVTAQLGSLAAGASATIEITVTAIGIGSAENVAWVSADEFDAVPANNEAHASTTILPSTGPDLAGSWSGVSETYRVTRRGATCTVRGTLDVSNIGDALAGRSTVTFYISPGPELTPDAVVLKTQSAGQLRVGARARVRLSATLPNGQTAHGRYLIAVLDSGSAVAESDEDNNIVVFGPIY